MQYILSLDQGTTSSRAVLINKEGQIKGIAQQEFTQIFPEAGWVEHDPIEIWKTQRDVMHQVVEDANIDAHQITAIGITNQRETTVVWNKTTGKPIYNAIVWQDKRTADICERLKKEGLEDHVKAKTGLLIDAYFSATKINWILDNVPKAKDLATKGELLFGTIDTWLLWKLTEGRVHATDYSNASRTMLYDIKELQWDDTLLKALDIPNSVLPTVQNSSGHFGTTNLNGTDVPITGIAGDQQAALFGQRCFEAGMAKNTYGTGCFMLMNTGTEAYNSASGLLSTIAWGIDDKITYALEGSGVIAGAAIQWLRDGLEIIDSASDSEALAATVKDSDDVYVVPAFAGLGAPYWDMYARGGIFGLTRNVSKAHLTKATLEALAYQSKDVLLAMEQDTGIQLSTLQVDGGASANNLLMQFQADILNVDVERPKIIELTALGTAYLAGLATGFWKIEELINSKAIDKQFTPNMEEQKRQRLYNGWQKAVKRCMNWIEPTETEK